MATVNLETIAGSRTNDYPLRTAKQWNPIHREQRTRAQPPYLWQQEDTAANR